MIFQGMLSILSKISFDVLDFDYVETKSETNGTPRFQ